MIKVNTDIFLVMKIVRLVPGYKSRKIHPIELKMEFSSNFQTRYLLLPSQVDTKNLFVFF
jgi:hypothetical protein